MTTKLIFILTLISTFDRLHNIDCGKYPEKYVPIDLDDALNYLDCRWSESDKDSFKNKPENDAVSELLYLVTKYGVFEIAGDYWKGDSKIAIIFARDLGINHPDEISSIILTSFHRYLNKNNINH